jgi:hypothetical protein
MYNVFILYLFIYNTYETLIYIGADFFLISQNEIYIHVYIYILFIMYLFQNVVIAEIIITKITSGIFCCFSKLIGVRER